MLCGPSEPPPPPGQRPPNSPPRVFDRWRADGSHRDRDRRPAAGHLLDPLLLNVDSGDPHAGGSACACAVVSRTASPVMRLVPRALCRWYRVRENEETGESSIDALALQTERTYVTTSADVCPTPPLP